MSDAVRVRRCTTGDDDVAVLWLMLTYAAWMSPGGEESLAEARRDPTVRPHVEGWGRAGDLGVLAFDEAGRALGAAWVRLRVPSDEPSIVATETEPELAIGVRPEARGRGIGEVLLRALFAEAAGSYPAIVLSVRDENPAGRLYERLGFSTQRAVSNRVGGRSRVMRRALAP